MSDRVDNAVPALRFRGFQAGFETRRLGAFFSTRRDKGIDGLPTWSVTLDRGLVNRDDLERKQKTNLTAKEHLLVREGDISYNMMRMWQGAFGRATSDGLVSPAYVVLRGAKDVDTRFFVYAFHRSRSIYLFWAYSYGLTKDRLRLYAKDFTRIPFSAPTLPEQEKISDFLTAVDKRIGQLTQKKALLEDYKKGVMQQLFSQAIRFKDDHGNDFPDWEEKKLGSLGTTYSGLSGKSGDDFGSGKPYVTYKQIFDQATIDFTKCKHVQIAPKEKQNPVEQWDILFTTSSETRLEVGYTSVVLDDPGEVYLNSFCFGFRLKKQSGLLTAFARYLFHSTGIRRAIAVLGQGSTRYNLPKKELMKVVLRFPNPDEQTKIANFLSAIDRKIESVATQITDTQTFKRGLLQQMFV
jgi:type I restriction enzyme S subunit